MPRTPSKIKKSSSFDRKGSNPPFKIKTDFETRKRLKKEEGAVVNLVKILDERRSMEIDPAFVEHLNEPTHKFPWISENAVDGLFKMSEEMPQHSTQQMGRTTTVPSSLLERPSQASHEAFSTSELTMPSPIGQQTAHSLSSFFTKEDRDLASRLLNQVGEGEVALSAEELGLDAAVAILELREKKFHEKPLNLDELNNGLREIETHFGFEPKSMKYVPPRTQEEAARVAFEINPYFEVHLNGSDIIEMRSQGSGISNRNSSNTKSDTRTIVQWHPQKLKLEDPNTKQEAGPFTVGRKMVASPLSQDHAPGSRASADTEQKKWMHLLPSSGRRKERRKKGDNGNLYYIRGHLLNDNLGGIANAVNLFPITKEANGKHLQFVEQHIKRGIDKGYVYHYHVEVGNVKVDWDNDVPAKGNVSKGAFTVNADLHFDYGLLDINGGILPQTRHTDVIQSLYSGGAVDPQQKGEPKPGGQEAILKTSQQAPKRSNAGLETTTTGQFQFPPVSTGLTLNLTPSTSSSQQINPSATLIPRGSSLSLKNSKKASVVDFFGQLVSGWTDVESWVKKVRARQSKVSTWEKVKEIAENQNLEQKLAEQIFDTDRKRYLVRVTIGGSAVNT